jgi:hypothetical protein
MPEKASGKPLTSGETMNSVQQRMNGEATAAGPAPVPVLYRRPRPLNADDHNGKSLRGPTDFRFAAATNSVVVSGPEFPFAMRSYPIVFSNSEPRAALAVLGLRDRENLFVQPNGQWRAGYYVPAYIRRYPFILMEQPNSDRYLLCIDDVEGLIGDTGDRPLFVAGEPSQLVKDAGNFCSELQGQHQTTLEFVRGLAQHQLLIPKEARFTTNSGEEITLRGFDVIDEAKFNALPDDAFLEFRRRGWLPLVYAHLMSMANWRVLADLTPMKK